MSHPWAWLIRWWGEGPVMLACAELGITLEELLDQAQARLGDGCATLADLIGEVAQSWRSADGR